MKARPHGFVEALRGDTLVCFLEKPSTRTRVSFAAAAERLGMLPLLIRPDELQLGRGETIEDTARTLSGYAAAIAARTFVQETVDRLADASGAPRWRRLVASPEPVGIVELETVRLLVDAEVLVVCAGGGGIPVVIDHGGGLRGVEEVIDKDLAAALLAELLEADVLLLLTDVTAVFRSFGTDRAEPIDQGTTGALRLERFPEGSMGPKV